MTKPSGPSKTYEERSEKGVALSCWLSHEAAAVLDDLVASGFASSKRGAIERLLFDASESWDGLERVEPAMAALPAQDGRRRAFEAPPPPGSPAELAARVRAKGARREATEVTTGTRVREGRRQR